MVFDPHDYVIEVCVICGGQLNRGTVTGRCTNRDHQKHGGMVVRVIPRPLEEQPQPATKRNWLAIPENQRR